MRTIKGLSWQIGNIVKMMLISLLIVCLVFAYFLHMTRISGDSMMNTLGSGDTVVMSAFYGKANSGDIVVIDADESVTYDYKGDLKSSIGMNKYIVKRIIATGGQTVDIDFSSGSVYVDGEKLSEPYLSSLTHLDEGGFTGAYPLKVPEGYVFVMGDNRRVSLDSRSDKLGFVKEDKIMGEVLFGVSPFGVIE